MCLESIFQPLRLLPSIYLFPSSAWRRKVPSPEVLPSVMRALRGSNLLSLHLLGAFPWCFPISPSHEAPLISFECSHPLLDAKHKPLLWVRILLHSVVISFYPSSNSVRDYKWQNFGYTIIVLCVDVSSFGCVVTPSVGGHTFWSPWPPLFPLSWHLVWCCMDMEAKPLPSPGRALGSGTTLPGEAEAAANWCFCHRHNSWDLSPKAQSLLPLTQETSKQKVVLVSWSVAQGLSMMQSSTSPGNYHEGAED